MNILVVNWQDITNPRAGGAEVHLHEIFSRIARRGHHVTLCCSSYGGAKSEEALDGIEIIRRGSRNFFNWRFPWVYFTLLRRRHFDVVIEDLNKIPFFTPLFVHPPLLGIAHHLFDRSIFLEAGALTASYVYWMERTALAFYRGRMPFMVVSASTREEFRGRGFPADELVVIHNCVDHARYTPGLGTKSPEPLVGYFGRLKRYKSIDQFLRALPLVREWFPHLKAVIAGDGDDRARLEAVVSELNIAHAVEFTGYLTEAQKVDLLRRMWCTVVPSSKEGWGLTVMEANACGTPAITSDVPGLRDAVRENETGLLYPYGDIAALAARMSLLLGNTELRSRLSANAIVWAKTFDWDDAADKTLAFLRARVQ